MSRQSKLSDMMQAALSTAGVDTGVEGSKDSSVSRIQNIELTKIYINPAQHRKYFDLDEQKKLQNAIQQNGFQGAILLRPLPANLQKAKNDGCEFELVYGESRTRAVRTMEWDSIDRKSVV